MRWTIEFYDKKVEASIKDWPEGILAKFVWISAVIEEAGPADVGMPHIKALGQGLFEIRVKGKEGIGRALFCTIRGRVVVVLNSFIKKTQKTPPSELALAKKRMAEVKKQ
ncbi:MAG: type II toxin-antitoxin system RelE/ParE family toxin [Candidatus Babeliales bacterium]|jgi:phage-related protein